MLKWRRFKRHVVHVFVLWIRNLLAVVEMGKRPTISIYNLIRFKHIRRLVAPLEMKANSFIKIQFTWDNLYLAVLTDKPDYVMYYYNWKLSKVESHVHVVHPPTTVGPVYDVICIHWYMSYYFTVERRRLRFGFPRMEIWWI